MPGWDSRPAACASFLKRAISVADWSSSISSLRITLRATVRWMCGSNALYTTPIAPLPSTSTMEYLPRRSGSGIGGVSRSREASVFQHLHRLGQALAQAPEGLGEHPDLVVAARAELGHVQLTQADAIGEVGQPRHRPDDDVLEHEVERDEDEREDPGERQHEHAESVVGALDRHGRGHRHDLCADHFIQLPAEAVRVAVMV